jgi:bacillithiol biosynthesis cysteine-adding enzyme BshC
MEVIKIEAQNIPQYSTRDKDYLLAPEKFSDFINKLPEISSFGELIQQRLKFHTNRTLLEQVAKEQYAGKDSSATTLKYLDQLSEANSFTVTTAHQPSLMTGPLYYCFKILSTIRLAEELRNQHPAYNIIPVFILGGEDHDFDEINHFIVFGKELSWKRDASGAVGRLSLDGLEEIVKSLAEILGEKTQVKDLIHELQNDLKHSKNYGEFAFSLTHWLFDHLGIVILRMDSPAFKKEFRPLIREEIFNNPSQALIEDTQSKLESLGYDKQAYAREINFFYHCEAGRKRINQEGEKYLVKDTDISFTSKELESAIDSQPEAFSPNVVMRPLYQELILPNLAYVGGGGELAYWMERKSQFKHFEIPFPMLVRRKSGMIMKDRQIKQIQALGLDMLDFFNAEHIIIDKYLKHSDQPDFSLIEFENEAENLFGKIEEIIKSIDTTLVKTNQSELAKTKKSIQYLESKLKKSVKQKEEVQLNRIRKIRDKLFPGGLQERHDNIFEYLSTEGKGLFDSMLPYMNPMQREFLVFIL